MIKSKLGAGMVSSDKNALDNLLDQAINIHPDEYGNVLEYVVTYLIEDNYSSALKSHAIRRSSWLKKYVYEYVQTH